VIEDFRAKGATCIQRVWDQNFNLIHEVK